MVVLPWEYAWSSGRAYARGQSDPLVPEDPCYREMSPDPPHRQALWRAFLLGEDAREGAGRRDDGAVGDDDFRKRLVQALGRPAPRRRGRPRTATGQG